VEDEGAELAGITPEAISKAFKIALNNAIAAKAAAQA
jgi:hypothetical protein